MRVGVLILALVLASASRQCDRAKPAPAARIEPEVSRHEPAARTPSTIAQAKIEFGAQVKPILQSRCTPCHFAGGALYQRLPFDQPSTIKTLGTKLFTRIRDESERSVIRAFLLQESESVVARPSSPQ